MSNLDVDPGFVNTFHDLPVPNPQKSSEADDTDALVIELFPQDYLKEKAGYQVKLNKEYTKLSLRELSRRNRFLEDAQKIEFSEEVPVVVEYDEAYRLAEEAWINIENFKYANGSDLGGTVLNFVFEPLPLTPHVKAEIKACFVADEDTKVLFDKDADYEQERKRYRLEVLEKNKREAAKYKAELEELVELDSAVTPFDITIVEVLDNDIDPVVLDELDELFRQSDEREAILAVESERIVKEEKKAQLAAIFKFFSEGLEEE